ncbi:Rec8 like protein-domain-containing protein [Vararia minispora EC-137]|uniref:Rec8 like protein-domain-containing protein n=1 Tax=Vararia minispora EC-137 TaxID=1314806 RepID=A0ACB8QG28_9AGAM|nr:Rec8 like protein-domain-containing protein [Vararia minispora EC-137]
MFAARQATDAPVDKGVRGLDVTFTALSDRAIYFEEEASMTVDIGDRVGQFYSEAILSRRGPLAKVWLAAHMERKLSKQQALQTDIEETVEVIVGQEIEVMALRLSGQLLLGVVRIYSRKAKYLLDDCNEALLKLKTAFRPGVVDMTEEQLNASSNAITLQPGGLDLDVLLPDMDWGVDFQDRVVQPQGHHVARQADITLADDELAYAMSDHGLDPDLGLPDGIGSQDFEIDLGLDMADGPLTPAPASSVRAPSEDSMSIGVGRDAATSRAPRQSLGSRFLGEQDVDMDVFSHHSRQPSREPDAFGFGDDFGVADFGGDMNIDLGLDLENPEQEDMTIAKTPEQTHSRASTPLSPPPVTPPAIDVAGDVTIADAETAPAPTTPPVPVSTKKRHQQKQVIDDHTELQKGKQRGGLGTQDVSAIVHDPRYLARSPLVERLLEIRADPLSHFLPVTTTPAGTFFNAGPPGMAPELQELFLRPVPTHGLSKRRGATPEKPASKRQRIEEPAPELELELEVEQPRGGSVAPSVGPVLGSMRGGSAVPGFGFEDAPVPYDEFEIGGPGFGEGADVSLPSRERASSRAPSELTRMSTPGVDEEGEGRETFADAECPIAEFDARGVSQATDTLGSDGKGYSKHTVKALRILRRGLEPSPEQSDEEKMVSFNQMATKATRRAAAGFFFELLVLGSRDCVRLKQAMPYGNIEVRAKDRLWEQGRHSSMVESSSQIGSRFESSSVLGSSS